MPVKTTPPPGSAAGVTHGFDPVQLLGERPSSPPQRAGLTGDLGGE